MLAMSDINIDQFFSIFANTGVPVSRSGAAYNTGINIAIHLIIQYIALAKVSNL